MSAHVSPPPRWACETHRGRDGRHEGSRVIDSIAPRPLAGFAPSPRLAVVSPPQARPSPSPGGPTVDAANVRHAEQLGRGASVEAGDALRRLYAATVGDDLHAASDASAAWPQRLLHGALVVGMLAGPEELGLEEVGKGIYVAAEHAADVVAGRGVAGAGRLVVREGASLDRNEAAVAAQLVHEERSVEALPASKRPGVQTPDLLVDGARTEIKTVSNVTSRDVTSAVKDIIKSGLKQAPNVIVDLRRQPGFTKEMATATIARLRGTPQSAAYDSIRMIGKDFDEVYRGPSR